MNCKDTNLNGARIKSGMLSPLSASVAAVPVKVCVEDPARLKDKTRTDPKQTQNNDGISINSSTFKACGRDGSGGGDCLGLTLGCRRFLCNYWFDSLARLLLACLEPSYFKPIDSQ